MRCSVREHERGLVEELERQLIAYSKESRPLPGIATADARESFVGQLIDSIRRVKYVYTIRDRDIAESCFDPTSDHFDPLKAAIAAQKRGDTEEAFWLVFLAIHFGKALRSGWRLARDIYGRMGDGNAWTWDISSERPDDFREWLAKHYSALKGDGVPRNFGNHRKYETLKPFSRRSTANVVASYIEWVGPSRSHLKLLQSAQKAVGDDPRQMFHYLFRSMEAVISFGRTARFDYLTMLGKLELAPIYPGSTYMEGATGPVRGARLLFSGVVNSNIERTLLDQWLVELDGTLPLGPFGMQILEDAVCNWQKSPTKFTRFRG